MISLDLTTDFAVFDNQQSITLAFRAGSPDESVNAIRRWVTAREADSSNGRYTTDDAVFHLSGVGLTGIPRVGDSLTDEDATTWNILSVRHERLTNRWECICRDLAIAHGLDTLVTIEVATFSRTEDGYQQETWSTEADGVRASFVEISATDQQENSVRELKPRFRAVLETSRNLENRRVIHDSQVYRITSYVDPVSIGNLQTVDLERW